MVYILVLYYWYVTKQSISKYNQPISIYIVTLCTIALLQKKKHFFYILIYIVNKIVSENQFSLVLHKKLYKKTKFIGGFSVHTTRLKKLYTTWCKLIWRAKYNKPLDYRHLCILEMKKKNSPFYSLMYTSEKERKERNSRETLKTTRLN